MAHGRPWYQRNGGDFVMAVMHFPDNDYRWAYSAIVDMLNDRDKPIVDDPTFLCSIARVTKQKWSKIRAYLLKGGYLIETSDGHLSNPRFERERAAREAAHLVSVEAGREGGKRSAAARAAGQSELQLDENLPRNLAKTSHVSSKKLGKFSESSPATDETDSPDNKDLAEPPPQPRARVSARQRRESRDKRRKKESVRSAESRVRAPARGPDGRPTGFDYRSEPDDAVALHLAELCGLDLGGTSRLKAAVERVAYWRNAGVDFEHTVEPVVRRMTASSDDRTSSLNRFHGSIMFEHNRPDEAQPMNGRQEEPVPVTTVHGEEPMCGSFREALLTIMGPRTYCSWFRDVHLGCEGQLIHIKPSSRFIGDWLRSNYRDQLTSAAVLVGATDVKIDTS